MPVRVVVKGASGSGKTTLSVALAERLGLVHVELDALHHGPNWAAPDPQEFRARVKRVLDAAPRGWVVDGNYDSKLDVLVIGAADTLVWLDLPLGMLLRRLWRRTAHRIRADDELWQGNRESWRNALWGWDALFVWMIRSFFRHRREWPRQLGAHPGFVRLRSAAEARRWLDQYVAAHQTDRRST